MRTSAVRLQWWSAASVWGRRWRQIDCGKRQFVKLARPRNHLYRTHRSSGSKPSEIRSDLRALGTYFTLKQTPNALEASAAWLVSWSCLDLILLGFHSSSLEAPRRLNIVRQAGV